MTTQTRDAATNQLEVQATAKQGTFSTLTTGNGAPVDTLTASMTAGERLCNRWIFLLQSAVTPLTTVDLNAM